jgi:hypothetical protein
MLLWIWLILLRSIGKADTDTDDASGYIVVEGHRDFEVYIAPALVKNAASEIEAVIGDYSVFGYASMYSRLAQIDNGTGGHKPMDEDFKVYNEDTIKYVWDNCDYIKDAKKCAFNNDHYLVETYITVDANQIVVEMFLYDSGLQIISRGSETSNLKVSWIKQQAIQTTQTQTLSDVQQQPRNCMQGDCYPVQPQQSNTTIIDSPKEEMPIRWEIPHKLLDGHIQQATMKMWLGTKLSND